MDIKRTLVGGSCQDPAGVVKVPKVVRKLAVAGSALLFGLLGLRFAAVFVLAASTSGCGDDCIERSANCSRAFREANGLEDASCCDGLTCCPLRLGSGVPTCNPVANCE
ncbi:MAG: hypothetical protein AAGD10_16270 [Myxococcota bacterium]